MTTPDQAAQIVGEGLNLIAGTNALTPIQFGQFRQAVQSRFPEIEPPSSNGQVAEAEVVD